MNKTNAQTRSCPSCGARDTGGEKCGKCGYRLRPGALSLGEIRFGNFKGFNGVSVEGERGFFLIVERRRRCWKFKLFDRGRNLEVTSWITTKKIENLKTSRSATLLRNQFKNRYTNFNEVFERVLILIENQEGELRPQEGGRGKEKEENEGFDEETERRARELLRDPAFFYKLGKVFEWGFFVPKLNKPRFVIGEERNKRLLGPLLMGASKLNMTSIIKLLGDIGTAKDSMLRLWLKLLPIKHIERSYLTAAALRYSEKIQDADLIYIPDSPVLRGETGRHMRFMRADDGGLISEYAMKDLETGEMTTKEVVLPVKGVATTSNAITGDPALESGMWTLRTNGSKDLTFLVKKEKLKLRAGKRNLFPEEELKVWECAFHLLLTENVPESLPKVPYAESLVAILESTRSESRRDPDKICDLISLIAWIRRFQKPFDEWNEADLADLYFALQIGLDAISQAVSELDEKELEIFNAVKEQGEYANGVTIKQVSEATGIPYKTCYRYLEYKLLTEGFVNKDKEKGRNIYSVSPKKNPKTLLINEGRNFEKPDEVMRFILDSFQCFSPSQADNPVILIDPISGGKVTAEKNSEGWKVAIKEVDEKLKNYPYPHEKVRSSERGTNQTSETKKKEVKLLPSEMRKEKPMFYWKRVEPAEPCELCGRFPVEYEITDPKHGTVLRRCQECFDDMRHKFSKVEWREKT